MILGSTYQSTRTSQPEPNIRNTFTYKSSSSVEFAPNRAEGQLELNFNQSNLDTGMSRSATQALKLTVGGNPFQSPSRFVRQWYGELKRQSNSDTVQ